MAAGAHNNQLKAAAEKDSYHGSSGNSDSSGHKQQSIRAVLEKTVVVAVVVEMAALMAMAMATAARTITTATMTATTTAAVDAVPGAAVVMGVAMVAAAHLATCHR
jgi:hypothetical protein